MVDDRVGGVILLAGTVSKAVRAITRDRVTACAALVLMLAGLPPELKARAEDLAELAELVTREGLGRIQTEVRRGTN